MLSMVWPYFMLCLCEHVPLVSRICHGYGTPYVPNGRPSKLSRYGEVQFESDAAKSELPIAQRCKFYRSAMSVKKVFPDSQFDRAIGLVMWMPAPAQVWNSGELREPVHTELVSQAVGQGKKNIPNLHSKKKCYEKTICANVTLGRLCIHKSYTTFIGGQYDSHRRDMSKTCLDGHNFK